MKQKKNIIQGVEANKIGNAEDQEKRIRCLTLNFFSYKMLIPGACVAEVIESVKIEPRLGAPEWFGGTIKWREREVPVLIFEKIMKITASKPQAYRRIIIINTPNSKGTDSFTAMGCQSIPSLNSIDEARLKLSKRMSKQVTHIKLDTEEYVIPIISVLEKHVSEVMNN
jgi:chemotaxis signal transduction protein